MIAPGPPENRMVVDDGHAHVIHYDPTHGGKVERRADSVVPCPGLDRGQTVPPRDSTGSWTPLNPGRRVREKVSATIVRGPRSLPLISRASRSLLARRACPAPPA